MKWILWKILRYLLLLRLQDLINFNFCFLLFGGFHRLCSFWFALHARNLFKLHLIILFFILFCHIQVFLLQIFKNVLNFFPNSASLKAIFVSFCNGLEPIFYHMFGTIFSHSFWDLGPFFPDISCASE